MGSAPAPGGGPGAAPPPALAVVLTAVALAAINLALAYGIARAAGMRAVSLPPLVVWPLVGLGLLAALGALVLWRRYLGR